MRFGWASGAVAVVAAAALSLAPAAVAKAPRDAIRVGELGGPGDARVAIVVSQRKLVGRTYKVVGGGVERGKLKKAKG